MNLFGTIFVKTVKFLWEESIYLVVYNVLTLIAVLGGPALLLSGIPIVMLIGGIFLFAAPPALFGIFWLTYQISLENAVGFGTYFEGAKQHLKATYIWGGINLVVVITLASNVLFYQGIEAQWSFWVGTLFMGLLISWVVVQLLMLALYPHMVEPNFKLTIRNALSLIAVNPFAVVGMAIVAIGILWLGVKIPLVLAFLSIAVAALIAAVTVAALVAVTRKK